MVDKIGWSQLTPEQQEAVSNGCGAGGKILCKLVPELLFHSSCDQHDYYFRRGGGLLDFIEANVMFYAHMIKSITGHTKNPVKRLLGFLAATFYLSCVTVFGWILFNWGAYKKISDIIK